jgi:hypothetical protein
MKKLLFGIFLISLVSCSKQNVELPGAKRGIEPMDTNIVIPSAGYVDVVNTLMADTLHGKHSKLVQTPGKAVIQLGNSKGAWSRDNYGEYKDTAITKYNYVNWCVSGMMAEDIAYYIPTMFDGVPAPAEIILGPVGDNEFATQYKPSWGIWPTKTWLDFAIQKATDVFKELRKRYPTTRISFISMDAAPRFWIDYPEGNDGNRLIDTAYNRVLAFTVLPSLGGLTSYIETNSKMTDWNPRRQKPEFYKGDGLHFTQLGDAQYRKIIIAHLKETYPIVVPPTTQPKPPVTQPKPPVKPPVVVIKPVVKPVTNVHKLTIIPPKGIIKTPRVGIIK